jgi:hypothetical protein
MPFPMPHPRRFCRSCSCCSFLPGRAPSCWPALAQQTQQFTSITPHFETHVRSIFINIASPAPASLPVFTAGLKPLCAELHPEEHTWPVSVYLPGGFKTKSYSTL